MKPKQFQSEGQVYENFKLKSQFGLRVDRPITTFVPLITQVTQLYHDDQ